LIARDKDGNLCLLDFKTSKKISDSYIRQIAGYSGLWNTNNTNKIHEEKGMQYCANQLKEGKSPYDWIKRWAIVRIGKEEEGDFEVVWYPQERIHNAMFVFKCQVALYWQMQKEKQAAKPAPKPRGRKKK
jgi:hypothetical protein